MRGSEVTNNVCCHLGDVFSKMSRASLIDVKVRIIDKLEAVCEKSIPNRGNRISEDTMIWHNIQVCVFVYLNYWIRIGHLDHKRPIVTNLDFYLKAAESLEYFKQRNMIFGF